MIFNTNTDNGEIILYESGNIYTPLTKPSSLFFYSSSSGKTYYNNGTISSNEDHFEFNAGSNLLSALANLYRIDFTPYNYLDIIANTSYIENACIKIITSLNGDLNSDLAIKTFKLPYSTTPTSVRYDISEITQLAYIAVYTLNNRIAYVYKIGVSQN